MLKMSKKALREEAKRLGAVEILGRKSNIYNYENERGRICKAFGYTYYGYAYSAGTYGNTGRIDEIVESNGDRVEYIFYTE